MREDIFRKKNLDRINSPESLNDYIRVTNPGVWIVIAALIVLLIGACIWGIYGRIECAVRAESGTVSRTGRKRLPHRTGSAASDGKLSVHHPLELQPFCRSGRIPRKQGVSE